MFKSIFISNRGEIACRIIKSAKKLGIRTIAAYSDADRNALHVQMAEDAVYLGPSEAAQSYLDIAKVVQAARDSNADAVHPGYGFLAENAEFAMALDDAGIAFIGPRPHAIQVMGDKIESKKLAAEAGVSTVPGYMGEIASADEAVEIARGIGYPVMIKASAGGGGKGMRVAASDEETREGFRVSKSEAANAFGDDRIFIEKFVVRPRHVEIQVLGDSYGNIIHLNERECSIQRRNQKVVEEAPSPFLDAATRRAMGEQAVALAEAVNYQSAGTVEFIVDAERNFYFLEMNTRLQVEHPVTELTTGIDLVDQMIKIAAGERLEISQDDIGINGWAIESRIYAEDPYRDFLPSIGRLVRYAPPSESKSGERVVRNDTGVFEGGEISIHYDPMISKLCAWAPDRERAIEAMRQSLDEYEIEGIGHNIPFLSAVMDHSDYQSGTATTAFIDEAFPDGFSGADHPEQVVRDLAASAAAMHAIAESRRSRISGRISNSARLSPEKCVVSIKEKDFKLELAADGEGFAAGLNDGSALRVVGDWRPGRRRTTFSVDGRQYHLHVRQMPLGFGIYYRGANMEFLVRTPRQAELGRHMAAKRRLDSSMSLRCPMPGLVTLIEVSEGDKVRQGQALCTIEAMKMENILRAEREAVVARILVAPKQSLAVDQVIMEFE